jgi:hypothetical protein
VPRVSTTSASRDGDPVGGGSARAPRWRYEKALVSYPDGDCETQRSSPGRPGSADQLPLWWPCPRWVSRPSSWSFPCLGSSDSVATALEATAWTGSGTGAGAPCSYASAGAKYSRQNAISRLTIDPMSAIFSLTLGRSLVIRTLSMSIAQPYLMGKSYSRGSVWVLGKDPHCRFPGTFAEIDQTRQFVTRTAALQLSIHQSGSCRFRPTFPLFFGTRGSHSTRSS